MQIKGFNGTSLSTESGKQSPMLSNGVVVGQDLPDGVTYQSVTYQSVTYRHGNDEYQHITNIGETTPVLVNPNAPNAVVSNTFKLNTDISSTPSTFDILSAPSEDESAKMLASIENGTLPNTNFKSMTVGSVQSVGTIDSEFRTGGNSSSITSINATSVSVYNITDSSPKDDQPWMFRLINTTQPLSEELIFKTMPTIQESNAAQWDPAPGNTHQPADTMVYKSSSSRNYSVTVKMIARDAYEADTTLRYMNILRAWTKPYFGRGTAQSLLADSADSAKFLGASPPILSMSAYGSMSINNITCVITSVDFSWPDDCDYVPSSKVYDHQPVPVVMSFSMSLKETYSPLQISNFNLFDYKEGRNVNFVDRDVLRARGDLIASSMMDTADKMFTEYPAHENMNSLYLGIPGDIYGKLNASEMQAFNKSMNGAKTLASSGKGVVSENGSSAPSAQADANTNRDPSVIASIGRGVSTVGTQVSGISNSVTSVTSEFLGSVKSKVKRGIDDIISNSVTSVTSEFLGSVKSKVKRGIDDIIGF